MREARALLSHRRQMQCGFIPLPDEVRIACWDRDQHSRMRSPQGGIATDVVGMGVRVDDAVERAAAQRVRDQISRLRSMAAVTGIDDGCLMPAGKDDVVGGQPPAFDHLQ